MTKRDVKTYREYWEHVHADNADDLIAVIHPGKPLYFNRFDDRMQKYALNKTIMHENIAFSGASLLDVGCGRGRWLRYFAERGARTFGIDLSCDAVSACRRYGLNAYQASAAQLPFANNSFDLVTSITVLLHLPPALKAEAVREISRVLKPKGRVILIESTWDDPAEHVFGQNLSTWEAMFAASGLSIRHASGHCFNFFRFRRRIRFLPYRLQDLAGTFLDYPLDYMLMNYYYGKRTDTGLQHVLVVEKV